MYPWATPGLPSVPARPGGVTAGVEPLPAGLDPHELHLGVVEKAQERAGGVGAPADAAVHPVRQAAGVGEHLLAAFLPDDLLERGDDLRERVRAAGGPKHVVGVVHGEGPVPQALVDGVLEGGRAVFHRNHLRPELLHPEDVGALPLHVHGTHVDGALEPEPGGHGGGGDAVLPGAGLGDDAFLAHTRHQQPLAHDVVDLVGAGLVEIFPFQIDPRPAQGLAQVRERSDRGGPARVGLHHRPELLPERRVLPRLLEGDDQLVQGRAQDLRRKGAAVGAEVTGALFHFFQQRFQHGSEDGYVRRVAFPKPRLRKI